jgi:hypothetical protein
MKEHKCVMCIIKISMPSLQAVYFDYGLQKKNDEEASNLAPSNPNRYIHPLSADDHLSLQYHGHNGMHTGMDKGRNHFHS